MVRAGLLFFLTLFIQYLEVPDGGTICIDITPPLYDEPPDNRPILVCMHGLTGGSHESVRQFILVLCLLERCLTSRLPVYTYGFSDIDKIKKSRGRRLEGYCCQLTRMRPRTSHNSQVVSVRPVEPPSMLVIYLTSWYLDI